jgi:hypothetical protein
LRLHHPEHRLPELAPALQHLPVKDRAKVAARIAARTGTPLGAPA